LRAPSWITTNKALKPNDPPLVQARNVYDLLGAESGRAVIVAAPGPSFASFPRDALLAHPTIGVNAILEILDPTYWVFAEPFFTRNYRKLYSESRAKIVTTRFQSIAALELLLPAGRDLFWFRYGHAPRLDQDDRRDPLNPKAGLSVLNMPKPADGRKPWWSIPEKGFLPGRCSVTTHAVSLAILLGAAAVILVGADFTHTDDAAYYAPGVTINHGPRRKTKALACGRNWAQLAAKKGVWEGTDLMTVSPTHSLTWERRTGETYGARRVTVDEAVRILKEINGEA
jgi:hypothetical protein